MGSSLYTWVFHGREQVETTSMKKKENSLTLKITELLSYPGGEKVNYQGGRRYWLGRLESGGQQQMHDMYGRRDRPASISIPAWKAVLIIRFDNSFWHVKSWWPFWGIHRNVVLAGISYWWTRDDGRKTKLSIMGRKEKKDQTRRYKICF